MSKRMRKMAAIAMAAAMAVSTPVAAAGSGATFSGTNSGTTSGTKSFVFYKENVTTVIVPTALTVAFNPEGLEVDLGNNEKSKDQVLSKSVALVSEAVQDYKIGVSFAVTADSSKINFVDSEDKVNKGNKHNVLLQVQTAADTGDFKVYSAAGSATTPAEIGVTSGALTVSPEQLSRAIMSGASSATGGIVPLQSGSTKVDFLLGKATYDYETIVLADHETSSGTNVISGTLSSIGIKSGTTLEDKTYSGIVGFKFTGKLNKYATWSEIGKNDKINIVPTYTCEKLEKNDKNQITENVLSGTRSFLGREATGFASFDGETFILPKSEEELWDAGTKPLFVRINGVDVSTNAVAAVDEDEMGHGNCYVSYADFFAAYLTSIGMTEEEYWAAVEREEITDDTTANKFKVVFNVAGFTYTNTIE